MSALPVHPRTGLCALGIVGGRPVWPVLGATGPGGTPSGQQQPGQQHSGGQEPTGQQPPPPGQQPPAPPPAPQPGQQTTGQPPTGQEPAGQPSTGQQGEPNRVEDLPEWAQRLIRDTRSEAAQNRVSRQEAETARQATLDAIAQALGVQGEQTPDPEALTADLAAARAESWQRAVELAVYRTAGNHQADPAALLDSRGFSQRVADLDPDADDFTDRIGAAVQAAITENPRLAAEPSPTGSAGAQQRDMGQGRRTATGSTGVAAGRELFEQRNKKKPTTVS